MKLKVSTLGGYFHEKGEWTQGYNEKLQRKHRIWE